MSRPRKLKVGGSVTGRGLRITLEGKPFDTRFPREIWAATPDDVKQALRDNLTFAATHFLPLVLGGERISYSTRMPLFESFLFRNQLGDLLHCERTDGAEHLSYMRRFYNLDFEFAPGESVIPSLPRRPAAPKRAVIPFTFGKESLVTFALCRELGIETILVYCEEPSQPYEHRYKLRALERIEKELGVRTYVIDHAAGAFRYARAFGGRRGVKAGTEVGWGSQTTILSLLMIPFALAFDAGLILYGSEHLNNEYRLQEGWKAYLSYDQTSFWTQQQSNMLRLLSGDRCRVHSVLEPLEEISIFHLLHRRYPELGRYQFSCSAEQPLVRGSQWCHRCYKCDRMYLFARSSGIDPAGLGFRRDLLNESGHYGSYFGREQRTGSMRELDFAFYSLYRRKEPSIYLPLFERSKKAALEPWSSYKSYFTRLKSSANLPPEHRERFLDVFSKELRRFDRAIS